MVAMDISNPGNSYMQIVKDQLCELGSDLLAEDLDLVCKYIVLRFLKTSMNAHNGVSQMEIEKHLYAFVRSIYPFVATFVMIVNSPSLLGTKANA